MTALIALLAKTNVTRSFSVFWLGRPRHPAHVLTQRGLQLEPMTT